MITRGWRLKVAQAFVTTYGRMANIVRFWNAMNIKRSLSRIWESIHANILINRFVRIQVDSRKNKLCNTLSEWRRIHFTFLKNPLQELSRRMLQTYIPAVLHFCVIIWWQWWEGIQIPQLSPMYLFCFIDFLTIISSQRVVSLITICNLKSKAVISYYIIISIIIQMSFLTGVIQYKSILLADHDSFHDRKLETLKKALSSTVWDEHDHPLKALFGR